MLSGTHAWAWGSSEKAPAQTAPTTTAATRYRITEKGLTLSELSKVIYGTSKRWKEIAEFNQMKAPYHLILGKWINLKDPVDVSKAAMDEKLLSYWRAKFDARERKLMAQNHPVPAPRQEHRTVAKAAPAPTTATAAPAPMREVASKQLPTETKSEIIERKRSTPVIREASPQVVAAIRESIKDETALREKTTSLIEKGKFKEAQVVCDDFLKEKPKSSAAWALKGEIYVKQDQPRDAVRAFHKARTQNPADLVPWFGEMRTLVELQKKPEAKAVAMDLIRVQPQLKGVPMIRGLMQ